MPPRSTTRRIQPNCKRPRGDWRTRYGGYVPNRRWDLLGGRSRVTRIPRPPKEAGGDAQPSPGSCAGTLSGGAADASRGANLGDGAVDRCSLWAGATYVGLCKNTTCQQPVGCLMAFRWGAQS
ncbi:hypothetical protein R1flu_003953 [Riccia fluitans]|uniref:Uncharacterized protein n=1 Tax=Riccia fluitans TaxID=41844 RepID=A0ABD1YPW0_9MARC